MKKVLSVFLTAVMLLSLTAGLDFSAYAFDSTGQIGDNVTYVFDINSGTLTISGTGDTYDYSWVKLTSSDPDPSPFHESDDIKSVVIKNGVTNIGDYLFGGCHGITEVTAASSVNTICKHAFYGCTGLTSIDVPEGVTKLEDDAYASCSNATSVTIPDSLTECKPGAFAGCTSLENVYINSLEAWYGINFNYWDTANPMYYAHNLYVNNELVEDLVIPGSVKTVNDNLQYAECIKSVTFSEGVETVKGGSFYYCHNINTLTIPKSLKVLERINYNATVTRINIKSLKAWCNLNSYRIYNFHKIYLNGKLIKDLKIPSGVKTIKGNSFANVESIKTVSIPSSVTKIVVTKNINAFDGCTNIKKFTVNSKNKKYTSSKGVLFNKKKTKIVRYPSAKTARSYTLPKGVKIIDAYAFDGSQYLANLTIPNSVKTIKECAFTSGSEPYIKKIRYKGKIADWNKIGIYGSDYGDGYVSRSEYVGNDANYKIKIFCKNGLIYNDHVCYESKAKVTKQPTFKSTGKKVYKCSKCKEKVTITLPKLGKPSISKLTKGKKAFTAKWEKVENIGGYQLQYSVYKNMKNAKKVKIKGNKTFKKTVSNLKSGKKYFVRIRAYKKINGKTKYSDWSAKKAVKTK
ncbi:MAG: fibronectin type III domain-containing protein [Eubacterium sp.]|nr:fibronectin type III domain-containing protein [Eubacterium sp.]